MVFPCLYNNLFILPPTSISCIDDLKLLFQKNKNKYFENFHKMESNSSVPIPGTRLSNLKKSFNRTLRSLLTACPKEDFREAFPNFTAAEKQRLHLLFIQVITSVHEDIEEGLESMFLETQIGTVLDSVEELVEEHNLDPLRSNKSKISEVSRSLSEAKKNELHHLTGLLKKAEEHKEKLNARLEILKKDKQDFTGAVNLINELKAGTVSYVTGR